MTIFEKHKEKLLEIVVNSDTPVPLIIEYLKEREQGISDLEVINCIVELAKTNITES